ncbi:MAG: DUF3987 domain-containing protein [Gemmatimonadales bacterium]|nr:DUF3987 domain-containing protein [Gemmatimonadales bacterium]
MPRVHKDWISAYIDYASFSEAPKRMHFWTAVSTIAGALRRRVWLDMAYFKWCANFYIIMVAPPGIVSKSTTTAIGIDLLRQVPGINFGPQVVTWPALVTAFAEANESFELNGEFHSQCALTLESSEFGNLVNPQDREMIDLLVTLWDSKQGGFKKMTKGSGTDQVENPWINLIACTTPAWIAGNFPEYVIGGGFTSRCLFVYTEEKEKFVAYPSLTVPKDLKEKQRLLVQDLEHIAINLVGGYTLSPEAIEWGTAWYEHHYKTRSPHLGEDDRFGGYIARKQTHIHKTAIVLAASQRDDLVITAEDLALANTMVTDLEKDMPKVFSKIGRTEESIQAERFIKFIQLRGQVEYAEAYKYIHTHFPDFRHFEQIVAGAVRSGQIEMVMAGSGFLLKAK